jgi:hypothetical protein
MLPHCPLRTYCVLSRTYNKSRRPSHRTHMYKISQYIAHNRPHSSPAKCLTLKPTESTPRSARHDTARSALQRPPPAPHAGRREGAGAIKDRWVRAGGAKAGSSPCFAAARDQRTTRSAHAGDSALRAAHSGEREQEREGGREVLMLVISAPFVAQRSTS